MVCYKWKEDIANISKSLDPRILVWTAGVSFICKMEVIEK